MAKTRTPRSPSARAQAEQLFIHLLALVVQTKQQVAQLSLFMDARASLEHPPVDPAKHAALNTALPEVQRAVFRQTLHDEMRRQLKGMSLTVDALYDCTDKVTNLAV